MIPRWAHRLYAAMAGYFWLPCPRCGQMFGGHEAYMPSVEVIPLATGPRPILCPDCTRAQESRDLAWLAEQSTPDPQRADVQAARGDVSRTPRG